MKLKSVLRGTLGVALFAAVTAAIASPITYTFSGLVSGTVDSVSSVKFSNAEITITLNSDTTLLVPPPPSSAPWPAVYTLTSGDISIAGVGDMLLSGEGQIYQAQLQGGGSDSQPWIIGFTGFGIPYDLLGISGDSVSSSNYQLGTATAPLSGDAYLPYYHRQPQFINLPTSLGALTVTAYAGTTFSAAMTSPVPEPATAGLMLIGMAGVTIGARRRLARG